MRSKLIWLLLLFAGNILAQREADSLRKRLKEVSNDSLRSVVYMQLTNAYRSEPGKVLDVAAEMIIYANGLSDKRMKSLWLRKIASIYNLQNLYDKGLEFGLRAASICEQLNDKAALATCYNTIGNAYAEKGTLTNDKALLDRSIEYHLKCIQLRKETADSTAMGGSYNNIAIDYMERKEMEKAIGYLNMAQKEYMKPPVDVRGLDMVMENMADAYLEMGKEKGNREFLSKALALSQERLAKFSDESDHTHVAALIRIGTIYQAMGDKAKAQEFLLNGMQAARKTGLTHDMFDAAEPLARLFEDAGDFKKAAEYLHVYMALKDTMVNESNSRNTEQMLALYQSGKKDREIEKLSTDRAIQEEQLRRQRLVILSVIGGLVLILTIVFVLLSRYNLKKKANLQLSDAYRKIETKNQQILDSINYAKRIQSSILPPEKKVREFLSGFFLFYAPRDIVSGDFYWFSRLKGHTFFVIADCTGHGVPGALMSMIGNTLLNEIINQKNVFDPGEILHHLDKGVTAALNQQDDDMLTQDDGMDITVCMLSDSEPLRLKYATANHSLFIRHNRTVSELKGDIFSIGGSMGTGHKQYTTQEAALEKGDVVILSTDGYYDQFGGPNDSKFLVTRFEDLVLSIDFNGDPAGAIRAAFEEWKGQGRQTDDILVAGFRV